MIYKEQNSKNVLLHFEVEECDEFHNDADCLILYPNIITYSHKVNRQSCWELPSYAFEYK